MDSSTDSCQPDTEIWTTVSFLDNYTLKLHTLSVLHNKLQLNSLKFFVLINKASWLRFEITFTDKKHFEAQTGNSEATTAGRNACSPRMLSLKSRELPAEHTIHMTSRLDN